MRASISRDVEATGPAGRVTRADVERARSRQGREAGGAGARPARPAPRPRPARDGDAARARFGSYAIQEGDRVIPMSPLRKLVAEHMVYSKRTSPHVGTVAEVDLGGVAAVRDEQKRAFAGGTRLPLTFLPFIVHATVRALREFPALNASVLEDAIVEKRDVHIGIAVETEKGLVVPVVRHADRLSLAGLAAAIEDLVEPRALEEALGRRAQGRHLHGLEPGPHREPLRLRDHQPAAGRHPAHGRDREAPGGARIFFQSLLPLSSDLLCDLL